MLTSSLWLSAFCNTCRHFDKELFHLKAVFTSLSNDTSSYEQSINQDFPWKTFSHRVYAQKQRRLHSVERCIVHLSNSIQEYAINANKMKCLFELSLAVSNQMTFPDLHLRLSQSNIRRSTLDIRQ